jgi:hypothetical protein
MFFFLFFCLSLFQGAFPSIFKDKKSLREVTKQRKSRFFLLFLLEGSLQIMKDQDPGGSKTYGSGSKTLVPVMPRVDIFVGKTERFAAATRFW